MLLGLSDLNSTGS